MDLDLCRTRLSAHSRAVAAMVEGLSGEEARWKPDARAWSVLEVVNHLADEERDDFRKRLDLTLHRPGEKWPPIDPETWAVERKYNERELGVSLTDYLAERGRSLEWLGTLRDPDWGATYTASFGEIRAGDLLVSWVAHDVLHLRQLCRLRYQRLERNFAPHSPVYAGRW